MIGKLALRIVTKPENLVSRIYKARYYSKSGFFDTKLGSNPSFIWRGIMEAQDIVKKGSRWAIGSGRNVRIWEDAWLPDDVNPFVQTEMNEQMRNSKVSGLMVPNQKAWDKDCLADLLEPRDRQLVLNIPLRHTQGEDRLIWIWEGKGHYFVKSCYKALTMVEP